jgi:O-antigen ligase
LDIDLALLKNNLAPTLGNITSQAIVAVTLLGAFCLGYFGAYVLMALSLASLVLGMPNLTRKLSIDERLVVSALALLGLAFLISGDAKHIVNFAMFALYVPVKRLLESSARGDASQKVAMLASVGTLLALGYSIYQVNYAQAPRATGFSSDPIWSAQAAVFVGFLAALGSFRAGRLTQLMFLVFGVLGVVVGAYSGSRGPILAVPVLGLICLMFIQKSGKLLSWRTALGLVVLMALCWAIWNAGSGRFSSIATSGSEILTSTQVSDASASHRVVMYQASFEAFLQSPWFGHGWQNRMSAIAPFLPEAYSDIPLIHHHLHSDVLDFGVSAGLLGLLAYALILIAPIAGALALPADSQSRFRMAAAIGLPVAYGIFGITYLTFGYELHTTLYVCFLAIILGYCRDAKPVAAG